MRLSKRTRQILDHLSGCLLTSTHRDREEYCKLVNAGCVEEIDDLTSKFLARVSGIRAPISYRITKKGIVELIGAPYLCAECGCGDEWRGHPLELRIERINGKAANLLCPNCYAVREHLGPQLAVRVKA